MADETQQPKPYDPDKIREIATRLFDPGVVAKDVPSAISLLARLINEACLYVKSTETNIMGALEGAAKLLAETKDKSERAFGGVMLLKKDLDALSGGAAPAPAQNGAGLPTDPNAPPSGAVDPASQKDVDYIMAGLKQPNPQEAVGGVQMSMAGASGPPVGVEGDGIAQAIASGNIDPAHANDVAWIMANVKP